MKKKNLTNKELRELDKILKNKFNSFIYSDLTKKENVGIFEPLVFFRLFRSQVAFVLENKKNPVLVSKTFDELDLTDLQKEFLFQYLIIRLEGFTEEVEDADIRICCRQIEELQQELYLSEDETTNNSVIETEDDFQELLLHLETLPTNKTKIAYLINEKTKYEQNNTELDWGFVGEKSFTQKCQLEIDKLKKLVKLGESENYSENDIKKHTDLTLDRAVLFMDYLFRDAKASSFNTKKAEAISFLTGFSEETLRQRLSTIYNEKNKKDKSYKKDIRIVRNLFDKLGLSEIVKSIDQDL